MRRRLLGGVVAALAITAGAVAISQAGSDSGRRQDRESPTTTAVAGEPVTTTSLPPPEDVPDQLPTVPYDPATGVIGTTVPVDPNAGTGVLSSGGA